VRLDPPTRPGNRWGSGSPRARARSGPLKAGDEQSAARGPARAPVRMNCLFFTTVFNVFTTDFHFFTTPPSILTTPPSILTTLLCSLRSEICCYLGLGRHAAHKIKKSGDALTVSAPNICPSTTTVGTPYVRVICTGAATQSACPVVMAGI
jgi:hypothetical protein